MMSAAPGVALSSDGIGGNDAADKNVAVDSGDKADGNTDALLHGSVATHDRIDGRNVGKRRADETRNDRRDNGHGRGNQNLNRENRSQMRIPLTRVASLDQSLLPICLGE